MKIALLSTGHPLYDTFPNGGGIQHQIRGLAMEMAAQGHDVHVICHSALQDSRVSRQVTFHALGGRSGPSDILAMLMFSRKASDLVTSLEPDIVSAFDRFSAYYPSHQSQPLTFTAENYDAFRYYREFAVGYNPLNALVHPWKRRLEEGIMERSDLVIAPTDSIKDYLLSIGVDRAMVIPNGVFNRDHRNLGDEGYILYAGRLDEPKRVDLLIQAFANLEEGCGDCMLRVVGRGPQKDRLVGLAEACGVAARVEFRDWVPGAELRSLLGNCRLFVLPSDFETFGIALLQAMACSKPVIASDIPGPGDIIEHGVDGLLFPRGDTQELTRAIDACINDETLSRRLGRHARRTAETYFDFSSIAEKTLTAYSTILNGRTTPGS